MFGMALLAGRKAGKRRPANIVLAGFALSTVGIAAIIPLVPRVDSGWYLVIPLLVAGSGLGLLVSQLNNFTLAPIAEERVSEAAGVNSAAGSFGLSFGLAVAGGLMLWVLALSFTHLTYSSAAIPPAQQQQIAAEMETNAEIMSNTQLQQQISSQPQSVQNAVLAINTEARNRSLQFALLVPAIAGLLGFAELVSDATPSGYQTRRTSRWCRFRLDLRLPPLVSAFGWGTSRAGHSRTPRVPRSMLVGGSGLHFCDAVFRSGLEPPDVVVHERGGRNPMGKD